MGLVQGNMNNMLSTENKTVVGQGLYFVDLFQ